MPFRSLLKLVNPINITGSNIAPITRTDKANILPLKIRLNTMPAITMYKGNLDNFR
jgi:hypothetical protein